jgi:1,4-dihydroxy-2-naphthoate octaprenyltransferase
MMVILVALVLTSLTSMLVNDYYDYKLGMDQLKTKGCGIGVCDHDSWCTGMIVCCGQSHAAILEMSFTKYKGFAIVPPTSCCAKWNKGLSLKLLQGLGYAEVDTTADVKGYLSLGQIGLLWHSSME